MTGLFSGESFEINAIERTRREVELRGGYINLVNSNPTDCDLMFPVEILQESFEAYLKSRHYTPHPKGLLEARSAIVEYYQRRDPNLNLEPDQIFLTASSSESYSFLFSLLGSKTGKLLGPSVTYPVYATIGDTTGKAIETYSLDGDLRELSPEHDAFIIVSPHNPTGRVWDQVNSRLSEAQTPIIGDEVFSEFPVHRERVPPLLSLYPDQPVFLLNGISKMFALPDFKLGWIVLNRKALALYGESLELMNDTFLSSTGFSQFLIPRLFQQGRPFQELARKRIQENEQMIWEKLNGYCDIRVQRPDAGWYVVCEIPRHDDEERLVIDLLHHGVLVHPGYFFDFEGPTRLVLSCMQRSDLLQEGLNRIRSYFAS